MKIKISNYFSNQELTFEFDPKFTHLDLRILGKLQAFLFYRKYKKCQIIIDNPASF